MDPSVPAWQLTSLLGFRLAPVSYRDGTWSMVLPGRAVTGRSLDEVLVGALREDGVLRR